MFSQVLSVLHMFTNFLVGGFLLALPIESSLQLYNFFSGCIFMSLMTLATASSRQQLLCLIPIGLSVKDFLEAILFVFLVFLPTPPDSFRNLTIVPRKRYPSWPLLFIFTNLDLEPLFLSWNVFVTHCHVCHWKGFLMGNFTDQSGRVKRRHGYNN